MGATSMMMPTNFMMMSFRLASSLPMGLCSPPQAETQKPKRMAKMMRGSMLDLSHRSEKSDTVRELTSSSPAVCASPTSLATSSMVVPAEGLNRLTHTSTQTPAMAPVKMKVPMVPPRILPRRFILAMPPTAEAMDTNTRGTTIVNSRLRKMSPMGLMVVPKLGATTPMRAPIRMPLRMRIRLPYCCQKLFFCRFAIWNLPPFTSPVWAQRALTAASSCFIARSSTLRGQAALRRM